MSLSDWTGVTTFEYDTGDRLKKVTYPGGQSISRVYDAAGRQQTLRYPDGFTTTYVYNQANRLESLRDLAGNTLVRYEYNIAGQLIQKSCSNLTTTTYSYYGDGRVWRIVTTSPSGGTIDFSEYTYDEVGRVKTTRSGNGTWTYRYDAFGQTISAIFESSNPEVPDRVLSYRYDSVGNLLDIAYNGVATTYLPNSVNEYMTPSSTFRYDLNGNLAFDGQATYKYDELDHLMEVDAPSGITRYEYNGLEKLAAITINGERHELLNDPVSAFGIVAEYINGNLSTSFIEGLGLAAMSMSVGGMYYFNFDTNGSTTSITDAAGTAVSRYVYDPFGTEILSSSQVPNRFTFLGQHGVRRDEKALYAMGMRFYRADIGRFTSADPLGIGGGDVNLYRYVFNSPQNLIDPGGGFAFVPILIGAGIGAATDIGIQLILNGGQFDQIDWGGVAIAGIAGGIGAGIGAMSLIVIV